MESHEIEALVQVVRGARRWQCCYDGFGRHPGPATLQREPHMCDCKYGATLEMLHKSGSGEQTGCPELREVEFVLGSLTQAEYERLFAQATERARAKFESKRSDAGWSEDLAAAPLDVVVLVTLTQPRLGRALTCEAIRTCRDGVRSSDPPHALPIWYCPHHHTPLEGLGDEVLAWRYKPEPYLRKPREA